MAIEDLDSKQELWRWILETAEAEGLPMGAVEGLQQAITPGKWQALELINGWANYGSGWSPAAYRTTPGGGIQLRGLVKQASGFGESAITVLPPAARPKEALSFAETSGLELAEINLSGSGEVIAVHAGAHAAGAISLSGIIFWPGS